jgi:hypothetical protein
MLIEVFELKFGNSLRNQIVQAEALKVAHQYIATPSQLCFT